MRSILGLLLALAAAAVFAYAYFEAVRPGASWLNAQGLFLAALPYNWIVLRILGSSDFSPDAPAQVAAAFAFEVALAYLAGWLVETLVRVLLRRLRFRSPA